MTPEHEWGDRLTSEYNRGYEAGRAHAEWQAGESTIYRGPDIIFADGSCYMFGEYVEMHAT